MAEEDSLHISITADTGGAAQNINTTADALDRLSRASGGSNGAMSDFVSTMSSSAQQLTSVGSSAASAVSYMSPIGNVLTSVADSFDRAALGLEGFGSSLAPAASVLHGLQSGCVTLAAAFDDVGGSINNTIQGVISASTYMSPLGDVFTKVADALDRTSIGFAESGGKLAPVASVLHGMQDAFVKMSVAADNGGRLIHGFLDKLGIKARESADETDKLKDKLNQLPSQPVNTLAASFGKLKGIIATLGIGSFVKQSNDAYNVQMTNELKLTSHMKHRMNATEEQIQAIKDLASAQQQIGVIGDEIQLAGAQQLTTYAKQVSTLEMLIPAMNNLIAQNAGYDASAGDATSAADMLGRALNGQYTALKRQGINFTEAQENILKYGTESQKAAVLAQAINDKVGNMNELLANTPTGKLKQLQNDFGDLQEQLGATFQPLISAVLPIARSALETLAPPIMLLSAGIVTVGEALSTLINPFTSTIILTGLATFGFIKLGLSIGFAKASLLVLTGILLMLIGTFKQNSIADTLKAAFGSIGDSTDDAKDSLSDYEDQLKKTESMLAGFDTITKLSGSSTSGLAEGLADIDYDKMVEEAEAAAAAVQEKFESIMPDLSWLDNFTSAWRTGVNEVKKFWKACSQFGANLHDLFANMGDDDGMYEPLKKLTKQIKNILDAVGLDGTGYIEFWENIGKDVYAALAGDDSPIFSGFKLIDKKARETFGGLYEQFSNYWQGVGGYLFDIAHKEQIEQNKLNGLYSAADLQQLVVEALEHGLSVEDSISAAKAQYLTTDSAIKWYENLDATAKLSDSRVGIWQSNLAEQGRINSMTPAVSSGSSTRYDIAQSYGPRQIDLNSLPKVENKITVLIDGVEHDYTITNG